MRFLYPAFLIGAAAIALPIVLHLLRRDVAPEVPFTAVRLLRRSPIERSRRRRLRELILLAARIAALVLLAAAFARPYIAGARGAGTLVIAIDRSFSMAAPGAFDRARASAREAIDAATAGERIAIVAFDDRAQVVAGPGSAGDARAAVAALRPGSGATRYAAAFARAAEVAGSGPAHLVLISDLQRTGLDGTGPVLPAGIDLTVRDVGGPATNLSVEDVRREDARVTAAIRNQGTSVRRGTARLSVDGREAASAGFSVQPNSTADVPFAVRVAASAALSVAVADPGGYPSDDVRFAAPGARVPGVLLVTGGRSSPAGFYLSRALAVQGDDDEEPAFDVHMATAAALSAMPVADLDRDAVVVLLSTQGIDRRARDALARVLARGGGVLVAAGPDVDAGVLSAAFGWSPPLAPTERPSPGALAATDLRHPAFRPFGSAVANLGQITFARAWAVADTGSWHALAEYTDGLPALLERRAANGRVILFTSDVDRRWNDFPLHPAFVPFVQELVRYLASDVPVKTRFTVGSAPSGVPAEPGIVTLADGRRAAVNVDPRESAIDRLDPAAFERSVAPVPRPDRGANTALAAAQVEAQQGYWRYGLILMLAALVAETFVGRS